MQLHSPPLDSDRHHVPCTAPKGKELQACCLHKAPEAGISSKPHPGTMASQCNTKSRGWLHITSCATTLSMRRVHMCARVCV